jgi:hypothetical protein
LTRAYIATVQVLIQPSAATTEAEACDWMSGLLSENTQVLDWQYLRLGGQRLTPSETFVNPETYKEGEAFA